jgi:hypothetical protein
MVEHLDATHSLDDPRKMRFSEQFAGVVTALVTTVTSDIISRYNEDAKVIRYFWAFRFCIPYLVEMRHYGYRGTYQYAQVTTTTFQKHCMISLLFFSKRIVLEDHCYCTFQKHHFIFAIFS